MRSHAILVAALVLIAAVPAATAGAATAEPAAQQDCTFPYSATDATGTEVTVDEEPQRIVVLSASTAQIMWEIGADSRVVGMPVNPSTAYLKGSSNRTNVMNPDGTIKQETVVSLEPDVVLAANIIPNKTIQDLRNAGLTVYKTPMEKSLAAIPRKVSRYGHFVGACEGAAATNQEFNASLEEIRSIADGGSSPPVLYYFFNFTAGNQTFIGEAITTAGAENVAAKAGITGYAQVNDEIVAKYDPVWIVTPSGASIPDREPYTSTIAVRYNQTLTVNSNYISQPGPRVVIPMRKMAEAFRDTRTPTATATASPTPTEAGDEPPAADSTVSGTKSGTPGFGLPVTLAALVAVAGALLARRD